MGWLTFRRGIGKYVVSTRSPTLQAQLLCHLMEFFRSHLSTLGAATQGLTAGLWQHGKVPLRYLDLPRIYEKFSAATS